MTWRVNVLMYGLAVMFAGIAIFLVSGPLRAIGEAGASAVSGGAAILGLLVGGLVGIEWQDRVTSDKSRGSLQLAADTSSLATMRPGATFTAVSAATGKRMVYFRTVNVDINNPVAFVDERGLVGGASGFFEPQSIRDLEERSR